MSVCGHGHENAGTVCAACHIELMSEIERLRAALRELLSGHDNLYVAHFGPTSNPHDDIAAKAARRALEGK